MAQNKSEDHENKNSTESTEHGSAFKDEEIEESGLNDEASESVSHIDVTPQQRLEALEKDHLYLRAELDNIKRQNIKERSQLLKYGAERLAKDLLDTLDVFKSALESDITSDNYTEFVNGVKMTAQSLKTALEKHGIKEVDCIGKAFDPNTQEALSSEPCDNVPEGHITQVFKAPYVYHDKLLRAGQVVVSRGNK